MSLGPHLERAGLDRTTVARLVGPLDFERIVVRPAPAVMRRLWLGPVAAMTLGRRIFLGEDKHSPTEFRRLLVHELVHVRQWRQAGATGFVRRYIGDYLRGRLGGSGHEDAYRNIRYEAEARRISQMV